MKIFIDARALDGKVGGLARYVEEVVKQLAQSQRYELYLVSNKPVIFDINSFEKLHVIYDSFYRFLPGSFWLTMRGSIIANNLGCTVLWGPAHVLPFFKSRKINYIVTFHDLVNKILPESMTLYNRVVSNLFYKRSLYIADKILVESYSTRDDLIRYYGDDVSKKSDVIYLGKTDVMPRFNSAFSVTEKDDYLFVLGSIEPRKNLIVLIRVFEELKKNFPKLKLYITGSDGWKNKDFFELLNGGHKYKKDILFTGFLDDEDVAFFMQNAKCFMFPSLYEGFGLPLIEAEGLCPAIINRIPVFEELSKHIENVQFCDFSESLDVITNNLSSLLSSELVPLKFKENQSEVFSWGFYGDKFIKHIEKIR